jgi:putative transposase
MFLTQINVILVLTKSEYAMLGEMCHYANNLYNVGLYSIRQHYFNEKQFLQYESNYHECKTNENYGLLQAGISQQILRAVDRSFKSFFNRIKMAKTGDYRFQDIKMPHYRKKGGMFWYYLQVLLP